MQASNEEMKASHEEVTSINEELQSTNEELEPSKEELQRLNEELTTVNARLQAKMAELEATTNDLASLLSSTDIAVLFLDPRFRIRRFTPAVRDLIDLIPSDIGRPLADLRRKFADPDLLPDARAVLDGLVPVERVVAGDAGREYLRRVLPYRTTDNRIDGVVVTFVDVTERRRADAALRSSEERTQLALDAAGMGSFVWRPAEDRGEPDARMLELFGLPPGAPLDLSAAAGTLIHPADRARYAAALARALDPAGTGELREDVRVVRPDGSEWWLAVVGRTEFGGAPRRAVLMAGVVADVTDRKRAEADLRASEARLRAVAANLPSGAAFVLDADLRYVLAAGEALAPAGLTPADLEGKTVAEVMPPDLVGEYAANYRRALGGEPFRVEHAAHGRHYVTHGVPVRDAAGLVTAVLAVSYDITDQKTAEAALRQTQEELEGRVRERTAALVAAEEGRRELLGRLVTGQEEERRRIARELHDSLGQYLTALGLGLKAAQAAAPAARDQLARLADLTAETGGEVHRLALELRPTALDDLGLAAAIRQYVETWAGRANVPAEFAARGLDGESFPWQVSTAVYRVVQEALTNVVRHARATRVSVLLERRPDHLLAVVEDNGVGFDPAAAPRTPRAVGGLGLPGMRERVALVAGTLQIESAPGAGTTVFVRTPLPPPGVAP